MCKFTIFRKPIFSKFKIMKSPISCLLQQAIQTFTCQKDTFQANFDELKSQLNNINDKDVNLNPNLMNDKWWKKPNKAPVTYIDIYEDSDLTVGVFVLKPGMKLPLHNHPEMHGLIKVITGAVKIRSFSINTLETQELDRTSDAPMTSYITAECHPEVIADANSECCVLNPTDKNLHEIETIQGPAAFIDILAPPYNTRITNNGIRDCKYFEVKHEIVPGIVQLLEINAPTWYWTDSYRYDGPELFSS